MSTEKLSTIATIVAGHRKIATADLRGPNRAHEFSRPRQEAIWIARELLGYSLPQIGRYFKRDHTTVLHALGRVADRMAGDFNYRSELVSMRAECETALTPRFIRHNAGLFKSRRAAQ